MEHLEAQEEPLSVSVRDGEIVVIGKRVAVALTRQAASETANRLQKAVADLEGGAHSSQAPASAR